MIKITADFYKILLKKFPFIPTQKQRELLNLLSIFIFNEEKESLFLLKGYAGTGKTTTISTFVNTLSSAGKKAVLLAPTGRAAKVIAVYSKRPAFTIHKKIYFPKKKYNHQLARNSMYPLIIFGACAVHFQYNNKHDKHCNNAAFLSLLLTAQYIH